MLGWEASHKKFCSPDVEERKVKESWKKQRAAGCDRLDELFNESGKEFSEEGQRVKELVCKKGGSSKKASTRLRAQNEGLAAVKEGNTPTLDKWLLKD